MQFSIHLANSSGSYCSSSDEDPSLSESNGRGFTSLSLPLPSDVVVLLVTALGTGAGRMVDIIFGSNLENADGGACTPTNAARAEAVQSPSS